MNTQSSEIAAEISQDDLCLCPSFNCYSSVKLAETAIKITEEHKLDNNGDEEFEFALARENGEFSLSADELFSNGPVFPVFNRDIIRLNNNNDEELGKFERIDESIPAVPLSQLFFEDRRDNYPPSCSSSESDESEDIPAGKYCVWRTKPIETTPSPSRCGKSKSTGSASKRWRFSDLLLRSNSEGKGSFVFLTPKKKLPEKRGESSRISIKGTASSAHEALYVRNRAAMEGNKKKSYLPYRRDLIGWIFR